MRKVCLLLIAVAASACDPPPQPPQSPTLTVIEAPKERVTASQNVRLHFSLDRDGTYAVRLLGAQAALVARGAVVAEAPVAIELAGSALALGENVLRVEGTGPSGGVDSATFTIIRDAETPLVPPSIAIMPDTVVLEAGALVDIDLIVLGDSVSVSVLPALPSFITFDKIGWRLTGTAQPLPQTTYVFTATGPSGSVDASLSLRVKDSISATLAPPPAPSGGVLGSHDTAALTATLTTDATTIECFDYTSMSFTACADPAHPRLTLSPSGRWQREYVADKMLRVRLAKANADSIERTFDPSALFSGVYVYECTQTVTSDESTAAFAARLAATNVLCLGDVDLQGTTSISINQPEPQVIVGLRATPARFLNTVATLFAVAPASAAIPGIVIANANLQTTATSAAAVAQSEGTLTLSHVTAQGVTIGAGVNAGAVAMNTNAVSLTLEQSQVTNSGTNDSAAAVRVDAGNLTIRDSTLTGAGGALMIFPSGTASTSTALRSTFRSTASNAISTIFVNGSNRSLTLTGCTVEEDGYTGVVAFEEALITIVGGRMTAPIAPIVVGSDAAYSHSRGNIVVSGARLETRSNGVLLWNGTLRLDNTTIVRLDAADAVSPPHYAVRLENSGGSGADLSTTSNGNSYCHVNAAHQFTSVDQGGVMTPILGTDTGPGAFSFAAQANGGAAIVCP